MLIEQVPYVDGWFGNERELTVAPTPKFPFGNNPIADLFSRAYERAYQTQTPLFLPKIDNRTSWSNLVTYSEQFDNAAWTKTNLTVTANAGTAPDGQATLDKLLETATAAEHNVTQAATVTNVEHELIAFAVAGLGRDWVRLAFIDSAAATFSAFFNVTSGYIGTASAGAAGSIVALGDGFFQCVMRFTPAAGAGTWKANVSTDGSTISYAGDITKGVYLWGAQVAAGVRPPYIATTTATRAVSAPDRDKVDPMAYLVKEEDPRLNNSETLIATRLFSRIPNNQVYPSSRSINKPAIPNEAAATYSIRSALVSAVEIATAVRNNTGIWLSDDRVFANFTTINAAVSFSAATGGTFTLTYKANTTGALNYNDSNATIAAALNALASVVSDGLTFTASNTLNAAAGELTLTITVGSTTTSVTMNATNITGVVTGGNKAFTYQISSTLQAVVLARVLAVPAHGNVATNALILINSANSGYVVPVGSWASFDANTIQVIANYTGSGNTQGSYGTVNYVADFLRNYTPGVTQISSTNTERYYLPGVSVGITTAADIPVQQSVIADADLIAAILAGGGTQVIAFEGPKQYVGPLLMTTTSEINLDNL